MGAKTAKIGDERGTVKTGKSFYFESDNFFAAGRVRGVFFTARSRLRFSGLAPHEQNQWIEFGIVQAMDKVDMQSLHLVDES